MHVFAPVAALVEHSSHTAQLLCYTPNHLTSISPEPPFLLLQLLSGRPLGGVDVLRARHLVDRAAHHALAGDARNGLQQESAANGMNADGMHNKVTDNMTKPRGRNVS